MTRMAPDCRTRRQSSRTVPEGSEGATEVSQATQAPAQGDDSMRVPINNHRIFFFYVAGAGNLHISCRKVGKMGVKFQENKAQKENFRIGKIRGPAWFRPLGVLVDTAKFALFGGSFGGRIRVRRILGACILDFSYTICNTGTRS